MINGVAAPPASTFSERVRQRFARRAQAYEAEAGLQRGIAWRLAHRIAALPLPPGPCGDLGAGTGLLGQALRQQLGNPERTAEALLQLDLCPELLAHNPLPRQQVWDLERGLPEALSGAALLSSSFALQWLPRPETQLRCWSRALAPGGWLVVAVPTAASFPQWQQAAAAARVPCTALPLPRAEALIAAAADELLLQQPQRLRFSRFYGSGLRFLRQLSHLGADASPSSPLRPGALRRLLQAWPQDGVVSWEVLMLVGQRKVGRSAPGQPS